MAHVNVFRDCLFGYPWILEDKFLNQSIARNYRPHGNKNCLHCVALETCVLVVMLTCNVEKVLLLSLSHPST